uniref:Uncharacterized protein n=1 Tax=Avena sativa TaxID=4498 RepID=A0ACD5TR72_AVESA
MIPLLALLFACFLRLQPATSATCSPNACGNMTIAYPFWLEEAGQPPCGSPSFQLRCDGTTRALLTHSMFGMYQVVEIFAENSSFVAVDHNLPLDDGCLPRWFNMSAGLGLSPFVISMKNRELLVLYNCTDEQRSTPQGFLRTPCRYGSFVHLGGEYGTLHDDPGDLPPACSLSVVPVLGFPGGDDYVGSLRGGFLLEWTVASDNCPKCVASGGECRYGNYGDGFY